MYCITVENKENKINSMDSMTTMDEVETGRSLGVHQEHITHSVSIGGHRHEIRPDKNTD